MRGLLRIGLLIALMLGLVLPTAAQPRATLRILLVGWPEDHVLGWMRAAQAEATASGRDLDAARLDPQPVGLSVRLRGGAGLHRP